MRLNPFHIALLVASGGLGPAPPKPDLGELAGTVFRKAEAIARADYAEERASAERGFVVAEVGGEA